jgi:Fe-S oxidoreductase
MHGRTPSEHERWLTYCSFCPNLCLHACPVSNAERRNAVSTWGKMSLARWVKEGMAGLTPENAEIFYKCTGCLGCQSACKHEVDAPAVLFHARAAAVATGASPYPASLFRRDDEAIRTSTEALRPGETGRPRAAYVPGCDIVTREPREVQLTLAVLGRLGFDVGLGPSRCCGYPLWAGGYLSEFADMAKAFAHDLEGSEVVLVGPGTCAHALRDLYEPSGVALRIPVRPVLQVIAERLGSAAYRPTGEAVAVYDGCHHARRFELASAARSIIERATGRPPIELRWTGKETSCCGAAGGYERTSPEGAAEAGRRVTTMARDAGATVLVTFDPSCRQHLAVSTSEITVESGIALTARALGVVAA